MSVVLLALGGYVYFIDLAKREEETVEKKLFTFDKEAVTAVTLTYPDRAIRLEKDAAGKWRITQPIEADADKETVKNLIAALTDTEIRRTLDEVPQDLTVYGLNAPVVKVQITLKDGKTLPTMSVGKDTPVGHAVYVRKEGAPQLLLTAQSFRLGMTKEVKDLRDKTIISFPEGEVKKIAISGSGKDIALKKAEGNWTLEKPVTARADETKVQAFLSALEGMRAQDFIEQPPLELKEFGLAPPQFTVSLTLDADGAHREILIGGEKSNTQGDKQHYIKRGAEDTLFLVAASAVRDLNKTADDFRDKAIARFAPDQAARVEITRQDGEGFILTRGADKNWTINKTQEGTLKQAQLNQFVTEVRELRGVEIAAESPNDLTAYGLKPPALTITVFDTAGAKLATVLAGQKAGEADEKAFVMAEGAGTVFTLRDYVFDRLDKKSADFWEKPAQKKEATSSPPS
ncbi:MAG: DUF4340 domain-containing protein [Candidatus Binatia bacterium]